MASELLTRLGNEMAEKHVEGEMKKAIDAGIAAGEDENAIVKRAYKNMFGPDSALVAAARAIPGFRILPHVLLTAAAEVLSRSADKLLPGDQRPIVRMVRLALKASAPALIGIGEAASDVIERQMNEAVDRTITPNTRPVATRTKLVDQIAIIEHSLFGITMPFFPVARDDDGNVRKTTWGNPIVLDVTYQRFIADYETRNPHRDETSGGGGRNQGGQRTTRVTQTSPVRLYTISEWASMVQASGAQVETERLEAIKRMFEPAKAGEWSQKVWDVIRAYMRSSARFQRSGQLDWLDHEESEGLIATLLSGKPDPKVVNELLGEGFHARIGQGAPEGEFSLEVLTEIETQAMDKWLGGEQPFLTKVVRSLRKMRRSAALQGSSGLYIAAAAISITSPIWAPLLMGVILFVWAARMYILGLTMPLEVTTVLPSGATVTVPAVGTFMGTSMPAHLAAMRNVYWAGILTFLVTCTFPLAQTAVGWITSHTRLDRDWLKSYGRRIAAFTIVMCDITVIAIMMGIAPDHREAIPLVLLVPVAAGFLFVEANHRYEAELAAVTSGKALAIVGVVHLVGFVFLDGWVKAHPAQVASTTGWVTGILAGNAWFQLALMFGALLGLSVAYSAFKYRKVPEGTAAGLSAPGFGPLLALIALCIGLGILSKSSWSVASTPAPVTPVVTDQAPVPVKMPQAPRQTTVWERLCADPELSYDSRKDINCPK